MIARLRGRLASRRPEEVVVDVAGVGYRLFVSLGTFYELPAAGDEVELMVHTVVREDAIHLYGFATQDEKAAFTQLVAVSGVGPRMALALLSGIQPAELWEAIRGRDIPRLTKVPGVGKKTANRLVEELAGRLPAVEEGPEAEAAPAGGVWEDAMSAMTNLGYSEPQAQKALTRAVAQLGEAAPLEEVLKACLSAMR